MEKKGGLLAILALTSVVANPFKAYSNIQNPSYANNPLVIQNYLKKDINLREIEERMYSKILPKRQLISLEDSFKITDFSQDNEEVLLARMILGEGEGCSNFEKIHIGYSAIVRAKDGKKWNGETVKQALLTPNQYESLSPYNKRSRILKNPMAYNPKEFLECLDLSKEILKGKYDKIVIKASHFYNPHLLKKKPSWTKEMIEIGKIGNSIHLFYLER